MAHTPDQYDENLGMVLRVEKFIEKRLLQLDKGGVWMVLVLRWYTHYLDC